MRTIERKMNAAIQDSKDWHLDNTEVNNVDGVSYVYLHGNLIAKVGDTWLELFDGGYRSKTTKSRLNAILQAHGNGERIFQKDWSWYITLDGKTVAFKTGILLD